MKFRTVSRTFFRSFAQVFAEVLKSATLPNLEPAITSESGRCRARARMKAIITSRGRVTLPKSVRDAVGLKSTTLPPRC
jgi:hypothetical protein